MNGKKIVVTQGTPGVFGYENTYIETSDGEWWLIQKHLKTGAIIQPKKLDKNPFPPEIWESLKVETTA